MSFIKVKDPRKREELVRDFIETRKRIKDNFVAKKVGESEYQTGLTKLFKPVKETQKATAKEITDAQKATAEKITQELLPIKTGLEKITVIPPIDGVITEKPAIETIKKEIQEYGPIAAENLQKYITPGVGGDLVNGVYFKDGKIKIGSEDIEIKGNDIIVGGEKYKGTPGLWNLITSKNIPNITEYEVGDLYIYIFLMANTNTAHIKYNPNRPFKSGNYKMENLIKPFVKELKNNGNNALVDKIEKYYKEETNYGEYKEFEEETDEDEAKGSGLKILPSDPNALIDRFDLLFSSKKAGHTGVRNEIVSILDELKRQGVIKTNDYKKLNSLIKK